MVDHPTTTDRIWFKNRAKEMIVQAVRPVLHSEEFVRAVRGVFAEFVSGPEFQAAMTAALPFDKIVQATKHASWMNTKDPVMMAAESLSIAARVDKGTQILLAEKYKELLRTKAPLPRFDEVGFRTFSQFDEDGILHYIFSLIGTTNRRAVEACAGVGFECNAANLIVNHGWDAMLIDGSEENCKVSWQFYTTRSDTQITPPKIVHSWIEPETIDGIVTGNGFTGEIDLLTIDLDGIDYWIWKNITSINPRLVVVEYQPWWKADEPYTVKNIKGYWYPNLAEKLPAYVGCSLGAYVNLAREKGYRLIGCNRNQLNAFFLRNDIAADIFPEIPATDCLTCRRVVEAQSYYRKVLDAQLAAGEWHRA